MQMPHYLLSWLSVESILLGSKLASMIKSFATIKKTGDMSYPIPVDR